MKKVNVLLAPVGSGKSKLSLKWWVESFSGVSTKMVELEMCIPSILPVDVNISKQFYVIVEYSNILNLNWYLKLHSTYRTEFFDPSQHQLQSSVGKHNLFSVLNFVNTDDVMSPVIVYSLHAHTQTPTLKQCHARHFENYFLSKVQKVVFILFILETKRSNNLPGIICSFLYVFNFPWKYKTFVCLFHRFCLWP